MKTETHTTETPCKITVSEIERIYAKSFAKLKTLNGSEFWQYVSVCQRILKWKMDKILSTHK